MAESNRNAAASRSPPPSTPRMEITLGVEFEFIILHHADPSATSPRPRPTVKEIAAVITKALNDETGTTAIGDTENYDIRDPPGQWRVTTDGSVKPKPMQSEPTETEKRMLREGNWLDAEVISCVFTDDGTPKPPGFSWSYVIPRVLDVLDKHFHLHVNDTTGFHVHIGIGLRMLDLDLVKKLSIFAVMNEDEIDRLHEDHRSQPEAHYCKSNRKNDFFWRLKDEAVIDEIAGAAGMPELVNRMCPINMDDYGRPNEPGRHFKLNLKGLVSQGTILDRGFYTMEWRHCEGTKDSKKACSWIRLILAATRKYDGMDLQEVVRMYKASDRPRLSTDRDLQAAYHGVGV